MHLTKRELPKITLGEPVVWGAEAISEIVFVRRVLTKDLFELTGNDLVNATMKQLAQIASGATDLPLAFFGELAPYDFQKVIEVIRGFFESSPPTGGSS